MSIAFDPVRTADDRQRLAALADEIWHEYWPALIGDAQTDYMVENFQSLEAIERDMREHAYEYWFMRAEDDGRIAGYTGGRAYLGKGFETIDAVETDIGNGFVMDDYIMEKHVER